MKSITITGTFGGKFNNSVTLDVYIPNTNPNSYDFRKRYTKSFEETLSDLDPDTKYNIDFTGSTPTSFKYEITGELLNPITPDEPQLHNSFNGGEIIKTNA